MDIRYAPAALADIDEIWRFAADRWGVAVAKDYLRGLSALCDQLMSNPQLGRDISEVREGYRKISHRSHMIYLSLCRRSGRRYTNSAPEYGCRQPSHLAIKQPFSAQAQAGGEGQGHAAIIALGHLGQLALHDAIIFAKDMVFEERYLLVAVALEQQQSGTLFSGRT